MLCAAKHRENSKRSTENLRGFARESTKHLLEEGESDGMLSKALHWHRQMTAVLNEWQAQNEEWHVYGSAGNSENVHLFHVDFPV